MPKPPAPPKSTKKPRAPRPPAAKPKLLSGGNPQIAKADGDPPVQAYIAALPGWKRDLARRLDQIITQTLPSTDLRKAVRWNSPFYGLAGRGWFLALHTFTSYIKITFFRGASLNPLPPRDSKSKDVRALDLRENDPLDEARLARWVLQASKLEGWGKN